METTLDKIRPELLLLAVILYLIGILLKKSKLKDNFIPLILGCLGVVCGVVYLGLVEGWSFASVINGVVQGVLCASASVYGNQLIKQLLKLNKVDEVTAEKVADKITETLEK